MNTKSVRVDELGSFYKLEEDVLMWQPIMQGSEYPHPDEWGEVEDDLIGDELVEFRGATMTLSEAYKIIIGEMVCEYCEGTGEMACDEDDGEGHIMRGVGTTKCICTYA